jgi:hypothetical protein
MGGATKRCAVVRQLKDSSITVAGCGNRQNQSPESTEFIKFEGSDQHKNQN